VTNQPSEVLEFFFEKRKGQKSEQKSATVILIQQANS
jgi:hypothetical protein